MGSAAVLAQQRHLLLYSVEYYIYICIYLILCKYGKYNLKLQWLDLSSVAIVYIISISIDEKCHLKKHCKIVICIYLQDNVELLSSISAKFIAPMSVSIHKIVLFLLFWVLEFSYGTFME